MTKEEAKNLSDVLKAYSEGKPIQIKYKHKEDWENIKEWKPRDYFDITKYDFRIMPEPKYRPYNTVWEFIEDAKKHGPYIVNDIEIAVIPEWHNGPNICLGQYSRITKKCLLEIWKWQDGSPCGVLEK